MQRFDCKRSFIDEAIERARNGEGGQYLYSIGAYNITVYKGDDEEMCFHVHEIVEKGSNKWIAEFIRLSDAEVFLNTLCSKERLV